MKAYKHLIKYALDQGFALSVFSWGDDYDLERSTKCKAIVDAVEAVNECQLVIHGHDLKRFAWVHVIPDLADDETIANWSSANKPATEWLEAWSSVYESIYQPE